MRNEKYDSFHSPLSQDREDQVFVTDECRQARPSARDSVFVFGAVTCSRVVSTPWWSVRFEWKQKATRAKIPKGAKNSRGQPTTVHRQNVDSLVECRRRYFLWRAPCIVCDARNYVSFFDTWSEDCEHQVHDELKYAPFYNCCRTFGRLCECVAHDADHVGDVQQARHPRGDPTCLVRVFFGTQDGQRDEFRRCYASLIPRREV